MSIVGRKQVDDRLESVLASASSADQDKVFIAPQNRFRGSLLGAYWFKPRRNPYALRTGNLDMTNHRPGLLIFLNAKPGKQAALTDFLNRGLAAVAEEAGTETWYAFQISDAKFGIYDTFRGDPARQQHLSGRLAKALSEVEHDLLDGPPEIRPIDVLAAKPNREM